MSNVEVADKTQQQWRTIITPDVPHFYFPWKEILEKKYLLYLLCRKHFLKKYKQTILGPAWIVIQPTVSTLAFLLLFNGLLNIDTGAVPPLLFYFSGNIFWFLFSNSFAKVREFLIGISPIVTKVYIPKHLFALGHFFIDFVNFIFQFIIFCFIYAYYIYTGEVSIGVHALLIPIYLVFLMLFSMGLGFIFSCITLKYRDLNTVFPYFTQLFMYATPIIYPMSSLKTSPYLVFIKLNPLTGIFEAIRYGLYGKGYFSWNLLLYDFILIIALFAIGIFMVSRAEKVYADVV